MRPITLKSERISWLLQTGGGYDELGVFSIRYKCNKIRVGDATFSKTLEVTQQN